MRRVYLLIFTLFVLWPGVGWAQNVWSVAPGFEAEPAAGDPVSEGDDRIRELKVEVRERAETEHCFGSAETDGCLGAGAGTDSGRHRLGSARVFFDTAEPANLGDPTGTVDDYDSSGGGGETDALDDGRLWIDEDSSISETSKAQSAGNNKLYVYDDTAGAWEEVSAIEGNEAELDDEILAGSYNLIYNGSFEATDGTGDSTSTTLPDGWTDGGTVCTHGYNDPSTDIAYGDGYEYECSGAGGGNAFIYQTLILPANQVFKVLARAKDDGTTVCTLDVTNEGGAAFTADSTTTDDWETLSGTFGTGGALDTVEVTLTRVTDTQVCLWDSIEVYRIDDVTTDRDEISDPGIVAMYTTYTGNAGLTSGSYGDVPNLEVTFNPPTPGWVVQVGYTVNAGGPLQQWQLTCRLKESGGGVTGTDTAIDAGNNTDSNSYSLSSVYVEINPTPGTPLVYTVGCDENGVAATYNTADSDSPDSNLWLIAYPTR